MKKFVSFILAAVLALTLAGCGSKQEEASKVSPEEGALVEAPAHEESMGETAPGLPKEITGMEGTPPMIPPGTGEGMPEGMPPGMGQRTPPAPKKIVVSDSTKKTWPAVKIMVKKKGSEDEGKIYEVTAGESLSIPDSNLRVEVGQYLPDFVMDAQTITSKSDELNNPTVKLTVYDGDMEVFNGWAFEKYPDAHAFVHPDYLVTLVGGVKAN